MRWGHYDAPMDQVWTNLLSGFFGAVVGGGIAFVGSIIGTKGANAHDRTMEDERDLRLHRAAVRVVVHELTTNLAALQVARNSNVRPPLATSAYDSVLLPLYASLPDNVAMLVASAYGFARVWNGDPRIAPSDGDELLVPARDALRGYAQRQLRLAFPPADIDRLAAEVREATGHQGYSSP